LRQIVNIVFHKPIKMNSLMGSVEVPHSPGDKVEDLLFNRLPESWRSLQRQLTAAKILISHVDCGLCLFYELY